MKPGATAAESDFVPLVSSEILNEAKAQRKARGRKHHTVFFRRLSKGQIGVITVLHESMNLPARLREDLAAD